MRKQFICSLCNKGFKTQAGGEMHLREFHKKKSGEVLKRRPKSHDDDDISYSDIAIEAEMNKAAGFPYEYWILGE
jgi:hypothetical protein